MRGTSQPSCWRTRQLRMAPVKHPNAWRRSLGRRPLRHRAMSRQHPLWAHAVTQLENPERGVADNDKSQAVLLATVTTAHTCLPQVSERMPSNHEASANGFTTSTSSPAPWHPSNAESMNGASPSSRGKEQAERRRRPSQP
mmetsp:Transcript_1136/g.2107  ORF Transcript_1136/g.2107 Transcript_1136/m.2107 type:complete len:141 (+) Transcript_1136:174-596(+)|eukprot:scaffold253755_cov33-Tisochrysis_lutea.AAC.1